MKRSIFIYFMLLISFSIFSQSQNFAKIPQEKWILENVTAFEENVQKPFSLDSLGYAIPTEIEVKQNEVVFVYKSYTGKFEYSHVVTEHVICFHACADWKIVGNKLQLKWEQDIEGEESKMFTIILTYKLK